jgi:hypothetical protein
MANESGTIDIVSHRTADLFEADGDDIVAGALLELIIKQRSRECVRAARYTRLAGFV